MPADLLLPFLCNEKRVKEENKRRKGRRRRGREGKEDEEEECQEPEEPIWRVLGMHGVYIHPISPNLSKGRSSNLRMYMSLSARRDTSRLYMGLYIWWKDLCIWCKNIGKGRERDLRIDEGYTEKKREEERSSLEVLTSPPLSLFHPGDVLESRRRTQEEWREKKSESREKEEKGVTGYRRLRTVAE